MTNTAPFALRGDRPIESAEEDRLGRAPFSRAIAGQILEAPALDSYVVAIMGPWGSGKTSLVNMIAEEAKLRSDAVVLKFNPWIFSGAEQLVGFFFRELGAQFAELKNDKLTAVGVSLKKYAGLFGSVAEFIPTVGGVIKKVADVAKDAGGALAEGPSIESQRDAIREQLKKIDKRIIVLVDDIDRLRRDEIRELVKLVRLTGDFPNVIYVLAFDRHRVESALGEDHETGRAYLEKIVQVAYDVPLALEADIAKLLVDELNAATAGIDHGPFDQMDWNNIFHGVIRPLVRSARDIRRYVNALPPTLRVIGREVALPDVLALEAVRVFLSDTFAKLPLLVDALTTRADGLSRDARQDPHAKAVQQLVEGAGDNKEIVRELLRRLFPHAERFLGGSHYGDGYGRAWHRARRVAVADVLRFYLERRLPEGVVPASEVEAAFRSLDNRAALTETLDQLDSARLENLLGRLEMFEDEFPPAHVEPAIGSLLDQVGTLREGRQHMFDLGADMALDRVVLRLLRRREAEADREGIITRLLPTLRWLSAQRGLIRLAEGHKLASVPAIETWKTELMGRLSNASPVQLAGERRLGVLLVEALEAGGAFAERALALVGDDAVLVRLLASVMSEPSSWSPGNVASVQELRLPWKDLMKLFGGSQFETRVREARARTSNDQLDARTSAALDLAMKYVEGWRPKGRFGEPDEETQAPSGEPVQDDETDEAVQGVAGAPTDDGLTEEPEQPA